jgi:hypothetical protein
MKQDVVAGAAQITSAVEINQSTGDTLLGHRADGDHLEALRNAYEYFRRLSSVALRAQGTFTQAQNLYTDGTKKVAGALADSSDVMVAGAVNTLIDHSDRRQTFGIGPKTSGAIGHNAARLAALLEEAVALGIDTQDQFGNLRTSLDTVYDDIPAAAKTVEDYGQQFGEM